MAGRKARQDGLLEAAISAGAALLCTYLSYRLMKKLLHSVPEHYKASKKKLCKELQIPESKLRLDEYEMALLQNLVLPHQVSCTLKDVAGADRVLDKLRQDIRFSRAIRSTSSASMLSGSKGLLLYGPPGTGKTMIASAFAREVGALLINVRGSSLFSKWMGDSERLTASVFSLAQKLAQQDQTVILFIDEVDALLGDGGGGEHDVRRNVRTEFMQLWDGLLRSPNVVVVAATNQPQSLSDAIWRRFSNHFEVALPDCGARVAIVQKKLRTVQSELRQQNAAWARLEFVPTVWFNMKAQTTLEHTAEGMPPLADLCTTLGVTEEIVRTVLKSRMHPLMRVARLTPGYSGSDLLEVCKLAARSCVLAELSRPVPASLPDSPVTATSNSPSSPSSPIRASGAAKDTSVGPGVGCFAGVGAGSGGEKKGAGARSCCEAAAGPVTEAVMLRCISEVKAAANTKRRDYSHSAGPQSSALDAPGIVQLLQALAAANGRDAGS
eukprot:jgi/Ulvmu1/11486/UM077_0035.1